MNKNIGWELYRSFFGVMQHGSLSAAARALGSTQPTIGRHITELERALNVPLFMRTQGGLTPTEGAKALVGHAQEMANVAQAMERVASSQGDNIQGTVRVTTSDIIGIEVLPNTLAKLGNQYAKLHLELVLSDKPQNLLSREADIAVRMFRPTQNQLIARRVGNIPLGFYAHSNYLTQVGIPTSIDDLKQHRFIGFDQFTDYIRETLKTLPFNLEKQHFSYRTDSNVAQLSLIRAGAGIGICQVSLAQREPSLVRILADDLNIPMEIWVTMHEDLRKSSSCQIVFDALVQGLSDYVNAEVAT